jgi:PiT family inorganic phosphate transporter
MGVGAATHFKAVRWIVARSIGIAWVLTIPAAGTVAALTYFVANLVA